MTYIYESPDGGHTVFRREIGSKEKTLHHVDSAIQDYVSTVQEIELWKNIRAAAKTNPALQSAMDRVRIIYELSRND